ncbi:MAG: hypothetical protein QXZ65_00650 [Metallosphaera sp.]
MLRVPFSRRNLYNISDKIARLIGSIGDLYPLDRVSSYKLFYNIIKGSIEVYGGDLGKIKRMANQSWLLLFISIGLEIYILYHFGIQFITLIIAIIMIYLSPVFYTKLKEAEYLAKLKQEAQSFSILLYLNSTLGKSLVESFNDISKSTFFSALHKELELINKYILFNGDTFNEAIQRRIRLLKNHLISKIYSAAISSQFKGISTTLRSLELIKELLNSSKESFNSYVSRSLEITEIMFSIFLLLPIVTIGFQSFSMSGQNTVGNLDLLIIPLFFAPLLYLWISNVQPKMGTRVRMSKYQVIGIALSSFIFLLKLSLLYKFLIVMIIIQIILFPTFLDIINQEKVLSDFPILLREISDFSRLGYGIKLAIKRIDLNRNNFQRATIRFLENIRENINKGRGMTQTYVKNEQIDAFLEILEILDRKGIEGMTVIQELSDLSDSMISARQKLRRDLQSFNVLALITPVLLWFATTSIGSIAHISTGTLNIIDLAYSLTLTALYSKISRFSIVNPPVFIAVAITTIILSLIPGSLILGL